MNHLTCLLPRHSRVMALALAALCLIAGIIGTTPAVAQEKENALCLKGLFLTPAQLAKAKDRMADPAWQQTAQRLQKRASALQTLIPSPYTGSSAAEFLRLGRSNLMASMDLALFAAVSAGEERDRAGRKAAEILLAWSGTVTEGQFSGIEAQKGNIDEYAGLGLRVGLMALGATHVYHLVSCGGFLRDAEDETVRQWLTRMANTVIEGNRRWATNGYFGGQTLNNHLSFHNAAVYAVGTAVGDARLRYWATADPLNATNFRVMVEKAIFDGKQPSPLARDQVNVPQRGEIYDRYRMASRKNGLHYAFFHLAALSLLSEVAANQGDDRVHLKVGQREPLIDALIYYGEFLARTSCSRSTAPMVEQGPPGFDYYTGAKIEAHYWVWIQPLIARLTSQPAVQQLSKKLSETSCTVPAPPYLPLPIVPLAQQR